MTCRNKDVVVDTSDFNITSMFYMKRSCLCVMLIFYSTSHIYFVANGRYLCLCLCNRLSSTYPNGLMNLKTKKIDFDK